MKIREIIKTADFFTLGNLIFGMMAIFKAISGVFSQSLLFLLGAMLFDFLDGKVARICKKATEQGKNFGRELDSLADVVSFGVAPSVIGYTLGLVLWWQMIFLFFFTSAGLLRLSRFNITSNEGFFEGLPITVNGGLFPLLFYLHLQYNFPIEYLLGVYLFMGLAMLSAYKIRKII